jgi:hypothetical protein
MIVQDFEYPVIAESTEPSVNRAPWREAIGQKPPGAACLQQIENDFDDFPHRSTPSLSARTLRRQIRLDQMPFRVGKIASIAKLSAAMMRAGGGVPHDGFQGCCRNPSESYRISIAHNYVTVPTQLFRTAVIQTFPVEVFATLGSIAAWTKPG